jgi:hypothetical protein
MNSLVDHVARCLVAFWVSGYVIIGNSVGLDRTTRCTRDATARLPPVGPSIACLAVARPMHKAHGEPKEDVMSFKQIAERELHERHVDVIYQCSLLAVIAVIVAAVLSA